MQKDSAADIELNLKKKARRRLVGAIAMVVLMVILLPILLKDRSAPVSQDDVKISIQHEEVVSPVEMAPTAPTDFDSNVVPAEKPATQKSSADSVAQVKPPETAISLPPPATSAKPAAIEDPEAAATAQQPKPAKPVDTPKDTTSKGQFFVQIGVFSEMANVKQLQFKLNSLGYQSKTEKISTPKGEKIRLRSQVFDSRNEAAIALQNIKEAGLTGMVVSQ